MNSSASKLPASALMTIVLLRTALHRIRPESMVSVCMHSGVVALISHSFIDPSSQVEIIMSRFMNTLTMLLVTLAGLLVTNRHRDFALS